MKMKKRVREGRKKKKRKNFRVGNFKLKISKMSNSINRKRRFSFGASKEPQPLIECFQVRTSRF